MDIVRNFISISGIAEEAELPSSFYGETIQYSENDVIHIPESYPLIKSIYQILIKIEARKERSIATPLGRTVILDGIKQLKILYSADNDTNSASVIDLELPYNTFFNLPKGIRAEGTSIYVLDAFFYRLDSRSVYSHIVYMVSVEFASEGVREKNNDEAFSDMSTEICLSDERAIMNTKAIGSGNSTFDRKKEVIMNDNVESRQQLIDIDAEYL